MPMSSYGRSTSRPVTSRSHAASRSRPKTAVTSTGYGDNEIICAVSESRGISPTIGLSFVNISTSEAILCQFTDTQTYARTCHKLFVFGPSEILYMSTASDSTLISVVTENIEVDKCGILMTKIDRKYWSENGGHDYLQHLAFPEDLESLKLSMSGNYFATCCFSAVLKYIELGLGTTFAAESVRIRFESSEGAMMIDLSTIASLELSQNLQNNKSRDSLYGLLNQTLTPTGARFLRSNVLQPSTDVEKIRKRHEALSELTTKEDMFCAIRSGLKGFVDTDRILAALVVIPTRLDLQYMEQSINNVLMLKTFVESIKSIWQALAGSLSQELHSIRELCNPENYAEVEALIKYCLNEDVGYSSKPTELRNQRVYAIRAGVNGFLDVARQTFKEISEDVFEMVNRLNDETEISLELKFDNSRRYYIRIKTAELAGPLPEIFINTFKRGKFTECQTLELVKMNQKIKDAHNEVISMSDKSIQGLIDNVRTRIQPLFKISEAIAMLDMLGSFAYLVTTNSYVRPELSSAEGDGTLAIKAGRHPIREKLQSGERFVPNDVFATPQTRFQIITGCNMSGKSTYIRTVALLAVMAQIGSFVPAAYASLPIVNELFARVSTDDSTEATVSTFSSEMREMAFILRNLTSQSLVLVDELGRGTSTTDGLAIAIAIAEALIESRATVWFVTHFRDLPRILAERAGVVNLHLAVDISSNADAEDGHETVKMKMHYRIADGFEEERFYGLALARVAGLPEDVIVTATQVSQALHERNEAQRRNPRATAVARRRKLVLSLREQLDQARRNGGGMGEGELARWLQQLQSEFMLRMSAINAEAESELVAAGGSESGDGPRSEGEDDVATVGSNDSRESSRNNVDVIELDDSD